MAANEGMKGALIGIVVGLAATAGFVVGPIMLATSFFNQQSIKKYEKEGTEAIATVTDKYYRQSTRRNRNYYLSVSFWDKNVLDGGNLYLEDIYVTYPVYKLYDEGSSAPVLYYFKKNNLKVMMKAGTRYENFPPMYKYNISGSVTGIGLLITLGAIVIARIRQKRKKSLATGIPDRPSHEGHGSPSS